MLELLSRDWQKLMTGVKRPSERSFGLTFAAAFAGLAAYGIYRDWDVLAVAAVAAASCVCLLLALTAPQALVPFNIAWFRFGMLLSRIVSPIVIGILFAFLITPIAITTRIFGRDELRLKPRRTGSYWIERQPPGPASDSFKHQF